MWIKYSIKERRERQGISQETLAELVGVSRQTISKWETETAYPSGKNLVRLSQVLGVSLDTLATGKMPAEPEIQVIETPIEIPVEGPAPQSRNYRLWALMVAMVLTTSILIGVLFFQKLRKESVSQIQMEGEVVDNLIIGESAPLLPMS